MKILKYKKLKTNTYKLVLDNKEELVLYDDTIIKYDLLRKKEINDIDSIIKYNKEIEAYYIAIKYITRKMRCSKEVREKLKDYPSRVIDNTIDRLNNEGYLNDKLYLEMSVREYSNYSIYGENKIIYKLSRLGFNKKDIEEELNNINREVFLNKINKLVDRKINSNTKYSKKKLREKILIDLVNQGYRKSDVIDTINNKNIEVSNNILEKEYSKYYRLLSKKYDGYELNNKLIQKLVSKGFNYEEVRFIVER